MLERIELPTESQRPTVSPSFFRKYYQAVQAMIATSGTTNPTVKLFCVDLDMVVQGNVTLVEIEHPPELSASERILSAVNFPTDELVYATWMNRVQNRAYFQLCDVDNLLPNCTTRSRAFRPFLAVRQIPSSVSYRNSDFREPLKGPSDSDEDPTRIPMIKLIS
ncbi:Dipeptidyl peptidase [Ooceraea biroi]|uniref:Dipeptidyl peptidase n=1 Tax=Ooceraea biroi TaxID=2015173 RepID=A0A026WLJ3_OOCBI|nr:Dipeptidyl peptidase [Ooceraea biroi]